MWTDLFLCYRLLFYRSDFILILSINSFLLALMRVHIACSSHSILLLFQFYISITVLFFFFIKLFSSILSFLFTLLCLSVYSYLLPNMRKKYFMILIFCSLRCKLVNFLKKLLSKIHFGFIQNFKFLC